MHTSAYSVNTSCTLAGIINVLAIFALTLFKPSDKLSIGNHDVTRKAGNCFWRQYLPKDSYDRVLAYVSASSNRTDLHTHLKQRRIN
jgi:hypothetical protein